MWVWSVCKSRFKAIYKILIMFNPNYIIEFAHLGDARIGGI